jgi:hypothetical protein
MILAKFFIFLWEVTNPVSGNRDNERTKYKAVMAETSRFTQVKPRVIGNESRHNHDSKNIEKNVEQFILKTELTNR